VKGSLQARGPGVWRLFVHVGYGPGGKRQVVTRTVARHQGVGGEGLVANPADRATPPRARKSEINPPDPAAVRRLIAEADASNPEFGMFLRLAASTGARRGELCALQWSDVDLERGSVAITKALEPYGAAGRIKETKTGNRRRVALDEATTALMREHALAMQRRASAVGGSLGPWVFSSDPACATPWHPASVTHWFGRLARSVGVACRLHDLRHFAATQALDAGLPVVAVSRRLGHARSSTTLDVYGHWVPDTDQEVAGALGRLLVGDESA
jgi:integrase